MCVKCITFTISHNHEITYPVSKILAIVEVEQRKYWLIPEISELAPFSRIFFVTHQRVWISLVCFTPYCVIIWQVRTFSLCEFNKICLWSKQITHFSLSLRLTPTFQHGWNNEWKFSYDTLSLMSWTTIFDVYSFEAKNWVFEFDYQKKTTFESIQCSKNDIWVSSKRNSANIVIGHAMF